MSLDGRRVTDFPIKYPLSCDMSSLLLIEIDVRCGTHVECYDLVLRSRCPCVCYTKVHQFLRYDKSLRVSRSANVHGYLLFPFRNNSPLTTTNPPPPLIRVPPRYTDPHSIRLTTEPTTNVSRPVCTWSLPSTLQGPLDDESFTVRSRRGATVTT